MNFKLKHLILAIFSLALLLATLFVPREAGNREELKKIGLGYPVFFVEQDFTKNYESFFFFPTWERFSFDFQKSPVKNFRVVSFLISFLFIFSALEIMIRLLEYLNFRVRRRGKGEKVV